METLILIAVLAVIIGLAIVFVVKSKKKKGGAHCIGCPCSGSCKGNCNLNEK